MRLLVGCPFWRREWIIGHWIEHVFKSCEKAGVSPAFVFVGDKTDPTWERILTYGEAILVEHSEDTDGPIPWERQRRWNEQDRLEKMVQVRNLLLGVVRENTPELFLSVDSDILLHEDAVSSLLDVINLHAYGAVGGKTYLAPSGIDSPSYAMLVNNHLRRFDATGILKVDVIMGIKLMSPEAYNIDYKYDFHGEDIGWAKNCAEQGVMLGWDGRVTSKHVFKPEKLNAVDDRCGF